MVAQERLGAGSPAADGHLKHVVGVEQNVPNGHASTRAAVCTGARSRPAAAHPNTSIRAMPAYTLAKAVSNPTEPWAAAAMSTPATPMVTDWPDRARQLRRGGVEAAVSVRCVPQDQHIERCERHARSEGGNTPSGEHQPTGHRRERNSRSDKEPECGQGEADANEPDAVLAVVSLRGPSLHPRASRPHQIRDGDRKCGDRGGVAVLERHHQRNEGSAAEEGTPENGSQRDRRGYPAPHPEGAGRDHAAKSPAEQGACRRRDGDEDRPRRPALPDALEHCDRSGHGDRVRQAVAAGRLRGCGVSAAEQRKHQHDRDEDERDEAEKRQAPGEQLGHRARNDRPGQSRDDERRADRRLHPGARVV